MYSDASRNFTLGFGAYCGEEWIYSPWDFKFCSQHQPSIEYLELYTLTVGVVSWLWKFPNMRIALFCDNQAVVNMVNNNTSKCSKCMILIRIIVMESMNYNTRVFAKFVRSKDNGKSDALSRLQLGRFRKLSTQDNMNTEPSQIPESMWPMRKVWWN